MLMPLHDRMPSFMNFRRVLVLLEFKKQVSQCLRPSDGGRVFEIPSHFYHGTYACNQGHRFDFSGVFWIYKNLKTNFLNVLGRATTPRCLNFIPISCMGPKHATKDTDLFFQTIYMHWSMCL